MSFENVELMRELTEGFLELGEGSLDAWLRDLASVLDPDVEWDASELPVPDIGGVYRGRDAVVKWWREWLEAWETVTFDYHLVDGGDRVILLLDQRMKGRYTGIELAVGKYAQLVTFAEGRIVHWRFYAHQSEALKAAEVEGGSPLDAESP